MKTFRNHVYASFIYQCANKRKQTWSYVTTTYKHCRWVKTNEEMTRKKIIINFASHLIQYFVFGVFFFLQSQLVIHFRADDQSWNILSYVFGTAPFLQYSMQYCKALLNYCKWALKYKEREICLLCSPKSTANGEWKNPFNLGWVKVQDF